MHAFTPGTLACFPCTIKMACVAFLMVVFTPVKAQLVEDPHITSLMERWTEYNKDHQEVRGWRIQILASIDRRQMESARRTFENRYPDYPVIFVHNEPYFHLKVGAFLTMQKAQALLKKLQEDYPQAIPVTDLLKVEELLLYDQ
jgi:hypothetical protein